METSRRASPPRPCARLRRGALAESGAVRRSTGVVQPQGAMAADNNGEPAAAGRQRYSVRLDKHAAYPASYPHEFELTCAAPAEPLAFSR